MDSIEWRVQMKYSLSLDRQAERRGRRTYGIHRHRQSSTCQSIIWTYIIARILRARRQRYLFWQSLIVNLNRLISFYVFTMRMNRCVCLLMLLACKQTTLEKRQRLGKSTFDDTKINTCGYFENRWCSWKMTMTDVVEMLVSLSNSQAQRNRNCTWIVRWAAGEAFSMGNVESFDNGRGVVFDMSQEGMTWWWCIALVDSPDSDERTTTAVDFLGWSQAGILSRLLGNE